MSTDPFALPAGLPVPIDDGAAAHLVGRRMPAIALVSTNGSDIDLAALPVGRTIIFAYPMTGQPGVELPDGWDAIPGARGCTPQNCSIRDAHADLRAHQATVFALSTQTPAYQREMADRLHLPYPVLSDSDFRLTDALELPTFETAGLRLLRRLTIIVRAGTIEHIIYPVFPPDQSAQAVLDWLDAAPLLAPIP